MDNHPYNTAELIPNTITINGVGFDSLVNVDFHICFTQYQNSGNINTDICILSPAINTPETNPYAISIASDTEILFTYYIKYNPNPILLNGYINIILSDGTYIPAQDNSFNNYYLS